MESNTWRNNVICDIHNHDMRHKLVSHLIACLLNPEEKEIISNLTLNMVQPKNILTTLKRKRPQDISNIKQVYNVRSQNNKAVIRDKIQMQQFLKLLDDNHYVSKYRVCEDVEIVRDIFWIHPDSIK